MDSSKVSLPAPMTVPISIDFGREGTRLYAEAIVATPDGEVRARMYPPHGVPQLYAKDAEVTTWLYSTACRAVESVLMQVMPHYARYVLLEQHERQARNRRVAQAFIKELEDRADD